ncbi:hypothetical protein C8R44DRAFT_812322 [Mycena epipterygia]|nr:hypothetical protein C8R44DRAFT_812322 [Mycena epipterygia]
MEPISQLAQELINHIITFLHDSPADWPAIALVCRSWVDPAQSHIFRRLPLYSPRRDENQRRWARFHATSINSPRLIRHVRQLDVTSFYVSAETFHAICNFPFTHLERVLVSYSNPTPLHTLGMQQLLSLPTLCRLTIGCHETEPAAFFEIWERFSAGLRHLELVYYSTSTELFHPTHNSPSFIGLESFNLPFTAVLGLLDWLMHPLCLFDFSGLKALSTANGMELLGSSNFAPALETIQTLNLFPTVFLSYFSTCCT